MPDSNIVPRPWWVRLFARPGSKRSAVRAGAISGCLLFGVAVLICACRQGARPSWVESALS